MKYVKLTAKKGTWFKEGTEVYQYDICDWDKRERLTLDEWNMWVESGLTCVRGITIFEGETEECVDGETCGIDEFDVEIVDEKV